MPTAKKPSQFAKFAGTTGQARPAASSASGSKEQSQQASDRLAGAVNSTSRRLPGALLVNVEAISLNPNQIRTEIDGPALEELIGDIKERGILEPLVVRQTPDKDYEIVAGQRRYMAARAAGLTEVPVVVKEMTDREARLAMLIENIQREELSPADEQAFYLTLQNEYNYSITDIAGLIHKSRQYVTRRLVGDIQSLQPAFPNKAQNAPALDSDGINNVSGPDTLSNVSQSDGLNRIDKMGRVRLVKTGSFNPVPFRKFNFTIEKVLKQLEDEDEPLTPETRSEIRQTVAEVEDTLARLKAKLGTPETTQSSTPDDETLIF